MDTKRIFRTLALALLWGMAVSTWAAIGHHLFGLPDIGLPSVIVTVAAILVWPSRAIVIPLRAGGVSDRLKIPHASD